MGSKYQTKAKANINKKKTTGKTKHRYYDEVSSKNTSHAKFPTVFFVIIAVIGIGVFGLGRILENATRESDDLDKNENVFYQENQEIEDFDDNGYEYALTITDINGIDYHLADYSGKIVVLYFHFLSCSACKSHSPNLAQVANQAEYSDVTVFSISVSPNDQTSELQEWKDSHDYPFVVVRDTDYTLGSIFKAQYTPHTVYLDPNGQPTTHTGAQSVSEIQEMISGLS